MTNRKFYGIPAKKIVYTSYIYGSGQPYVLPTVHFMESLPKKTVYTHRLYMVLANPMYDRPTVHFMESLPKNRVCIVYIWFWPTLCMTNRKFHEIPAEKPCMHGIYMVLANPMYDQP